jgi:pimeloyl-[acyl-carrier protein] synthase
MGEQLFRMYDIMRAESPVVWNEGAQTWMIFKYSDVVNALRDPALSSGARLNRLREELGLVLPHAKAEQAVQIFARQLETCDPPKHTVVRHAFNLGVHNVLPKLRATINSMIGELHFKHGWRFPLDVLSTLARPLPLHVVLELLGIQHSMRAGFTEAIAAYLRHLSYPDVDGAHALSRIRSDIRAARDGILAEMAQQENTLDEDDLVANSILLVSAGHRTTSNLIGSLLFMILNNRLELERLVKNPSLIPGTVEEVLRLESPIQSLLRTSISSTAIGGVKIGAGQTVTLVLGSANRDPRQFPDANRFDPLRSPNHHLAFGYSTHYCLGAVVARMQAVAVLESLIPHLSRLRISEAIWREETESRSLARLSINLQT